MQSLVVLTDGNENRSLYIADVADQINENTYSVGVGTAANTSAAALQTISGNNGGYLLITGAALGGDNEFLLKKYFLQILAGVSNAEVVLDPVGWISGRQLQKVPFVVCDQDNLADVMLLAQDRKYLQFVLETPSGLLVDPAAARAAGGQFVATERVSYYRIPLPLLVDPGRPSHGGTWNAWLGYGRGQTPGVASHVDTNAAGADRRNAALLGHRACLVRRGIHRERAPERLHARRQREPERGPECRGRALHREFIRARRRHQARRHDDHGELGSAGR